MNRSIFRLPLALTALAGSLLLGSAALSTPPVEKPSVPQRVEVLASPGHQSLDALRTDSVLSQVSTQVLMHQRSTGNEPVEAGKLFDFLSKTFDDVSFDPDGDESEYIWLIVDGEMVLYCYSSTTILIRDAESPSVRVVVHSGMVL